MTPRSVRLFLEDMLEAMAKVQRYSAGMDQAGFNADELVRDAIIRNIEIIGEVARQLPQEFRDKHKEIPWHRMIGLRNIVTHAYFGIDTTIIWEIVSRNIPDIEPMIEALVSEIDKDTE